MTILLFGMPRSGTTWLGKIFDSHPRVLYRHEPDTWQRLTDVPIIADPSHCASHRHQIVDFVAQLPDMTADRVCGKRPLFPKAYTSRWSVTRHAALSVMHKAAARAGVRTTAPSPPQPAPGQEYRVAWKSIESLGRLGLILECLPEARSVHIIRHPCGYVASVLRGEAAERFDSNAAASDFPIYELLAASEPARRRGLGMQQFRSMPVVERLAWRWVIFNEIAWEQATGNPRNHVQYYEELCARPEEVSRLLFEFCALDWNDQTAQFIRSSTKHSRDDYYSVFKDPLRSAWHWRSQMSPADVAIIARVTAGSTPARPYFLESSWNRPSGEFVLPG